MDSTCLVKASLYRSISLNLKIKIHTNITTLEIAHTVVLKVVLNAISKGIYIISIKDTYNITTTYFSSAVVIFLERVDATDATDTILTILVKLERCICAADSPVSGSPRNSLRAAYPQYTPNVSVQTTSPKREEKIYKKRPAPET